MKSFLKYTFLLIPIILIALFMANWHESEERLKKSDIDSQFNFDTNRSFPEYINYSRKIIAAGRVDLDKNNLDEIVSWNSPFILEPRQDQCPASKKGILLIHGLSDSPFSTRKMARYFNDNCFLVYSILLAGHGTRPGDLLKVSYQDWIRQVHYAATELSKRVDQLYLGSYSTGTALAVNYLLSNPSKKAEALIALSPALNIKNLAAFSTFLKHFKKYNKIHHDKDRVKYESFAMNATQQVYLLTKKLNKKLKNNNSVLKNIKFFTALSYEDKTINSTKTLNTILNNTDPKKRHIILYHQNELPPEIINQENLYPIKSHSTEEKILNLSHISIPYGPKNIWYGKNGKYRSCLHYHQKNEYDLCKSSNEVFYGEVTPENLEKGTIVRLSYNPFINKLFADIGEFLGIKL